MLKILNRFKKLIKQYIKKLYSIFILWEKFFLKGFS